MSLSAPYGTTTAFGAFTFGAVLPFALAESSASAALGFGGEPIVPVLGLSFSRRFGGRDALLETPSAAESPPATPSDRFAAACCSTSPNACSGAAGAGFCFFGGRPRRRGSDVWGRASPPLSVEPASGLFLDCSLSNAFTGAEVGGSGYTAAVATCCSLSGGMVLVGCPTPLVEAVVIGSRMGNWIAAAAGTGGCIDACPPVCPSLWTLSVPTLAPSPEVGPVLAAAKRGCSFFGWPAPGSRAMMTTAADDIGLKKSSFWLAVRPLRRLRRVKQTKDARTLPPRTLPQFCFEGRCQVGACIRKNGHSLLGGCIDEC